MKKKGWQNRNAIIVAIALTAVAISSAWWLKPLLQFVGANSELIQGLQAGIQIVFWVGAAVAAGVVWWRRAHGPAEEKGEPASPSKSVVAGQHLQSPGGEKRVYVVFCRICGLSDSSKADEVAAHHQVLIDTFTQARVGRADEISSEHSSVYGRIFCMKNPVPALEAAIQVLDETARGGVRLAIGITVGSLEEVQDFEKPNRIGKALNLAARLAADKKADGKIHVEKGAYADIQSARFPETSFGEPVNGKVKATEFGYRPLMHSPRVYGAAPHAGKYPTFVAHAIVCDVAGFSGKNLDDQWEAFMILREKVIATLGRDGVRRARANQLWYSPGGDGGVLVFSEADEGGEAAFAFAQRLAEACRDKVAVRVGIATGSVVVIAGNLPVGSGILRADRLSAYPGNWQMCVNTAFWEDRTDRDKKQWRSEKHESDDDAHLLWPTTVLGEKRPSPDSLEQKPALELTGGASAPVNPFAEDFSSVRRAYLESVVVDCSHLKLEAIDQGAVRLGSKPVVLTSVYVNLNCDLRIPAKLSLTEYWDRCLQNLGSPGRMEEMRGEELRPVQVLEAMAAERILVLLGPPGSGKSTLVTYVALSLAQASLDVTGALDRLGAGWKYGPLLPVRVILRRFAAEIAANQSLGRAGDLWEFIGKEAAKEGRSPQSGACLRKIAAEVGAFFLFDGLDEAPEASVRKCVIDAVAEFVASAGPKCRYLVTSRPYAWEENSRARKIGHGLQSANAWVCGDGYRLGEFEPEQIKLFIERWYPAIQAAGWMGQTGADEKKQSLLQAVERPDLRPLARNPLLLTLMATLHSNRARLPDDRADLYNEVVELLLQRWNESSGADRGLLDALAVPGLKLADLREVVQSLAFDAHSTSAGKAGMADIAETHLVASLRPLLKNSADKAELALDYIEKRAGLLLGQGERGLLRQYTFPHRTFQEYLAACHLAGLDDFSEKAADLAHSNPAHWREVLVLAARQAKAARGVPAADALIYRQSVDDWSRKKACPENDWRAATLAGEMLLEIGLPAVESREGYRAVRERVTGWLLAAMERSKLPAVDRAKAGVMLARLGDPRLDVVPAGLEDLGAMEFCYIPLGPFVMGEGHDRHENTSLVGGYWMSRCPVTQGQFKLFAGDGGYRERRFWPEAEKAGFWKEGKFKGKYDSEFRERPAEHGSPLNLANHPVVGVTWYEALAFCRWLAEGWQKELPSGYSFVLPSEAEWEKAARGGMELRESLARRPLRESLSLPNAAPMKANLAPEREYPWLGDFDAEKANCSETGIGTTSAVGCFPGGTAPSGVQDLSGNVWEWTRSCFKDYPYVPDDGREDLQALPESIRVLRGGAFNNVRVYVRCAYRLRDGPNGRYVVIGFRLVASPFSSSER